MAKGDVDAAVEADDESWDVLDDESDAWDGVGDDDVDFPVGDGANLRDADRPHVVTVPDRDNRPAQVRLAELLGRMEARRKTLTEILRHCEQRRPVREVGDFVEGLRRSDHSVYTADDLLTLLERAGGIERVGEDGSTYEERHLEPREVELDGVVYLEPATPPAAFWQTTEAGAAVVTADDPASKIEAVLEDDGTYLPIYRRILTLCARESGASAKELARAVDKDPLLASPRCYSSRFVEKLNVAEGLAWDADAKVWRTTDAGLVALDDLAAVDDPASDAVAQG